MPLLQMLPWIYRWKVKIVHCLYVIAKSDQPLPSETFFADVSQLPSYKVVKSSWLAGSKHVFVTETQLPKSESCYAEKDDVVSKPVPWNMVSLLNSSFLMNWESPTHVIHLHSLDPLRWFNSLLWQKTNWGGRIHPHLLFCLFLIISSKCHKKDKGHDCTTGSWRGEIFEQQWAVMLTQLLRQSQSYPFF